MTLRDDSEQSLAQKRQNVVGRLLSARRQLARLLGGEWKGGAEPMLELADVGERVRGGERENGASES